MRDILDGTSNTIAVGEIASMGADIGAVPGMGAIRTAETTFDASRYDSPISCLTTVTNGRYNSGLSTGLWRGLSWAGGAAGINAVNTILPPNSPACNASTTWSHDNRGQHPITSKHAGGVQVLMADGAVRFVSQNINTGDLTQPDARTSGGPGPYGVWGSLGSIAGGEVIGEF